MSIFVCIGRNTFLESIIQAFIAAIGLAVRSKFLLEAVVRCGIVFQVYCHGFICFDNKVIKAHCVVIGNSFLDPIVWNVDAALDLVDQVEHVVPAAVVIYILGNEEIAAQVGHTVQREGIIPTIGSFCL